jgi:S-adenosylmethionine uptake transporter
MTRAALPLPILSALLAVALLSLMDALMKGASLAIGAYSAAFLRAVVGLALVAPIWLLRGGRWPSRDVLRVHLLRGVCGSFMALTFFYALTKLPLAETIAISFVAPLVALYLAAIFLGERIRREAIVAAVLGLAGTLVIIGGKVGREPMGEDALLGLASILFSALLYAGNLVISRHQAQLAEPLEISAFHSGVGAAVLGLAAPFLLRLPDGEAALLIGGSAVLTVIGMVAFAWAYARAEAQVLVPMEYSGFLWASLFGWLFFAEAVTATTVLGTALIVFGCWLAARRKDTEQVVV